MKKQIKTYVLLPAFAVLLVATLPAFAGRMFYVSANGTSAAPYDTWAKATADLSVAVTAAHQAISEGLTTSAKVVVTNGTYKIPETLQDGIEISQAIEIVSVNGPGVTILDSPRDENSSRHRHFTIKHKDGVLSGFTLTGGCAKNDSVVAYASVLSMSAGTVTNCVIKSLSKTNTKSQIMSLSGTAHLTDCEIDASEFGQEGITIEMWLAGGLVLTGESLVDRCRIYGMKSLCRSDSEPTGGAVILNSAKAEIRNSLIYGCSMENWKNIVDCGVIQIGAEGGKIVNCTIVNNTVEGHGVVKFYGSNGAMTNTIVTASFLLDGVRKANGIYAASEGATIAYSCADSFEGVAGGVDVMCKQLTPIFNGSDNSMGLPEYSLKKSFANLLPGIKFDWMKGTTDLSGNPRIIDKIPEMGCYENTLVSKGLCVIVR